MNILSHPIRTVATSEIRLAEAAITSAIGHLLKEAANLPPFSLQKKHFGELASDLHDVKHKLREVSNASPSPP